MIADRTFYQIHRQNTSFTLEPRSGLSPRPEAGENKTLLTGYAIPAGCVDILAFAILDFPYQY